MRVCVRVRVALLEEAIGCDVDAVTFERRRCRVHWRFIAARQVAIDGGAGIVQGSLQTPLRFVQSGQNFVAIIDTDSGVDVAGQQHAGDGGVIAGDFGQVLRREPGEQILQGSVGHGPAYVVGVSSAVLFW